MVGIRKYPKYLGGNGWASPPALCICFQETTLVRQVVLLATKILRSTLLDALDLASVLEKKNCFSSHKISLGDLA